MKNYIKNFPILKWFYWLGSFLFLIILVYGGYLIKLSHLSGNNSMLVPVDHSILLLRDQPTNINALSYIVGNLQTGQIFLNHNADLHLYPASISKLMTAVVVLDHFNPQDLIEVSNYAVSAEGTEGNLEAGEIFTVSNLLKVMLITSSNDAAIAFEEAFAKKNLDLVALMNAKAKELGMYNSAFFGSTGLDRKGNFSTANDLFILLRQIYQKYPLLKEITSINNTTVYSNLPSRPHFLKNTNLLLDSYSNIILGKTGTTPNAKECLAVAFNFSVKNDTIPLGIIVLYSSDRFNDVIKLYHWFANNII